MKILIINGPNINMLGIREENIYGTKNYKELERYLYEVAEKLSIEVEIFQSNSEGAIIDKLQEGYFNDVDGIVINPGAYTHYSYAIYDALKSIAPIKIIEVHLSNIHARDKFRKNCVTTPATQGQISGLGYKGYALALEWFSHA